MSRRELKRLLEGRKDGIGTEAKDSNRNSFSIDGEKRQFAMVGLSGTSSFSRKEVECPICLGLIRKIRITKCGHRFCKECIEKSIRLGNHKCPFCRVHFPSRRSLEADEHFDKFIADQYPDNDDQYEKEQDLELNKTEPIRSDQIKATTSQTLKRQCETSSKRSTTVETPREDETITRPIPLRGVREVPRHDGSSKKDPVASNKDKDKDPSSGDHDHRVEAIPARRTKIPIRRRRKRARMVSLSQLPDTWINVQPNPLRTLKDSIPIRHSSEDEETDSSSGDEWRPLRRKKRDKGVGSSQPPENRIIILDSPLQHTTNVQTPALSCKDKEKAPCSASDDDRFAEAIQLSENRIIISASPLQDRTNVQTPALSGKDKGKAPCSASDGYRVVEVIELSDTESEDDSDENGSGESKEESLVTNGTPSVLPESIKWGRSGMRSRVSKRNRIDRLVRYLQNLKRTQEKV